MLGRDAFMWSDRVGLKGATNGEHEVANSTACAAVFAFKPKPMVRRMNESNHRRMSGETDHVTCMYELESLRTPEEKSPRRGGRHNRESARNELVLLPKR